MNTELRLFAAYLKALARFAPARFLLACALNLVAVFLSGIGLLALLPLLHYAGWLPGDFSSTLLDGFLRRLPSAEGRLPLAGALLAFVLLIAIAAGLDHARQVLTLRLRLDFLFEQRRRLNAALANARWSHLLERRLQHAHHMVSIGLNQVAALTQYSLQLVSETLAAGVYLAFSLALSVPLTLLTGAAALLLLALHRGLAAARWGRAHFVANRLLQERLAQFLDGVKPSKAGNLSGAYARRFESLLRDEQSHQWGFARAQARARFSLAVLSAAIFAVAFWAGATLLDLPVAVFLMLLVVYARLMPRVAGMLQLYQQAVNLAPVYGEMRAMLADYESAPEAPASGKSVPLSREIRLENVRYAHPGGRGILGVSAVIPANSTTAITGSSGSGKTTLADLLLGLLAPRRA